MMAERRFEHANNPGFPCGKSVILLPFGRRSFLPAIVERAGGEEIALDETTDRIAYRLRAGVTLIYSGMGAPAAANALEMAAANGARRVVVFGACGGADPRLEVGHLLVVGGAVRGEGTSRYYAPAAFPASFDPLLTARLRCMSVWSTPPTLATAREPRSTRTAPGSFSASTRSARRRP
jgi:hypothetical protein